MGEAPPVRGTDRAVFLARVRQALRASPRSAEPGAPAPEPVPEPGAPADEAPVATFCREAEAAGATVSRVDSLDEARGRVDELIREAQLVARGNTELVRDLRIDVPLGERGAAARVCDLTLSGASRESLREIVAGADAGLTEADYGVAESGTLAILHRPGQGRSLSVLPPVHVALLRARDIVPDLGALFDRMAYEGRALGSALTFITGPSRTADIEMVITQGVHGPARLHIVVLEG